MGAQGTPGTNGTNGTVGPAGPIGPMGPAGTNGTNGINGENGTSFDIIYRRSSTVLSGIPSNTGITATNGQLNNAPTDWSLSEPGGTDDLYISIATITGTGVISFSAPIKKTGEQGQMGIQGNPGPTGGIGPMGPAGTNGTNGANGVNGFGYQNFYHANTANMVAQPAIGYNSTSFALVSWARRCV